ncbi:DNA-J related domain-containing protein [Marinobacter sp. JSM 1782161]|uniref:DNA-J related domain-containing protein n=1 Tax=Marinobacter sp. JSM 1782161 TaxID=2685906 RepID=UPI001402239E|nr:DNA-J related domain-containing protein [Marinobacter sp. JSM 1782161]
MEASTTTPDDGQGARAARSAALQQKIAAVMAAAEAILREQAEGVSELALIRQLQQPPWQLLDSVDFSEPSAIYPAHFLLFHCLYRLRDDLNANGEQLDISPMRIRIRLSPMVSGDGMPGNCDRLREFYLDLSQYNLSEGAVQRMLDDFWAGRAPVTADRDSLDEAAQVLGFEAIPDDFATIRQAYRRQAMHAHPDRGGTKEAVQDLNAAFHTLRDYFLSSATADR